MLGTPVLIGSQHNLDEAALAIDADDLAVAERFVEHRVAGFERDEGRPRARCLCWCCDSRFAPDGRSLGAIECSLRLTELRFMAPFHVLEHVGPYSVVLAVPHGSIRRFGAIGLRAAPRSLRFWLHLVLGAKRCGAMPCLLRPRPCFVCWSCPAQCETIRRRSCVRCSYDGAAFLLASLL